MPHPRRWSDMAGTSTPYARAASGDGDVSPVTAVARGHRNTREPAAAHAACPRSTASRPGARVVVVRRSPVGGKSACAPLSDGTSVTLVPPVPGRKPFRLQEITEAHGYDQGPSLVGLIA